jgi:hypothetical protein
MPPVNRSLTMQVRRALYSLKRDYGARIDIYTLGDSTTDPQTGEKQITKTMFPITRGIVMPVKLDRAAVQGIALISSNKEFVSGGTYDKGTRDFIVDRRDCPSLPELTSDDWIVYFNEKYQIKSVETFEVSAGWIITASKINGEVPEQHLVAKADHLLNFQSTVSVVVVSNEPYRAFEDTLVFTSVATATVETP